MNETIVKSQADLDAIAADYDGVIKVKCAPPGWIVVKQRYKYSVIACGSSNVVAWNNSNVEAWDSSNVEAWDSSNVVAWNNSNVVARNNSNVEAWGSSNVVAWNNSNVVAWNNSNVEAWDSSNVEAWDSSNVKAWGSSSVEAYDNSSVEAYGNCQVLNAERKNESITVHANARIVYNPANIEEWADWYGIPITDGKIKLYKAVHKIKDMYFADFNREFEYTIGETVVADCFSLDNTEECVHGIHMAVKAYAVDYGKSWADMAILELEADASEVVVPLYNCWKARAPKVKVIREVPLSELGKMGEFYAKRHDLKLEEAKKHDD